MPFRSSVARIAAKRVAGHTDVKSDRDRSLIEPVHVLVERY
jgi:hypothetical protein